MVEATVVLPVFILLLVGATFLRTLYIAQADTRLTARHCAWSYALEGCRGNAPAECTPPAIGSAHDGRVPDIAEKARLQVGDSDNPFRKVPVVREALADLFGSSTSAAVSATVRYPLDVERVGVAAASATVVCNSISTEVIDIAKEQLCEHLPCP